MNLRTRAVALLTLLVSMTGCAEYWQYRADDFADTFDIGITVSDDWQFAFYHSFESIVTIGWSDFEGTFYGWGGGQTGKRRIYLNGEGYLLYGVEEIAWDDYDKSDPNTLFTQTTGIVGMPMGFVSGNSNPHYIPT